MAKPNVGIIYSESQDGSLESKSLALYFTGQLLAKGYCNVFLVGMSPNSRPCEYGVAQKIKYSNPRDSIVKEVPVSDFKYSHFNVLLECHLIVVTVNAKDTSNLVEKLHGILQDKKNIPIFSLQRGVRSSSLLKDELEAKYGCTVIEGVVGFAVIADEKTGVLKPTCLFPRLMIERLSKEAVAVADGPLRLLETMNFSFLFRKIVTPYSWGVLLFENIFALNVLSGGKFGYTLSNQACRRVLAIMMRESRQILKAAAGNGNSWSPEFLLLSELWTPWLWEMALWLPNPLFGLAELILGSPIDLQASSPSQHDIFQGRIPNIESGLLEIIQTGKRYDQDFPVLSKVYEAMERMGKMKPSQYFEVALTNQGVKEISEFVESRMSSGKSKESQLEFQFWTIRLILGILLIPALYFLFIHE